MSFYDSTIRFAGVSQVTATLGKNDPEIGARCTVGNANYVFVYCSDEAAPGLAVTMTGTAGGFTVSVGTVTGVDYPVGWVQHTTLTTGTYGWVATGGILKVQMSAAVSCPTGGLLAVGGNGFMIPSQLSLATSTLQAPAVARAVSNIASTTSGYAYVR